MPEKRFQKKVENFICANCGHQVIGRGYTDHCPKCLYSKHVDLNPGDRKNHCQGLMKPIGIKIKKQKYIIVYQCTKCGLGHQVKQAPDDDFEEILKLSYNNFKN